MQLIKTVDGHSHQGERLTVSAGNTPLTVLSTNPSGELLLLLTEPQNWSTMEEIQTCNNAKICITLYWKASKLLYLHKGITDRINENFMV